MTARPRCHECGHPGRHRRVVTDRKPSCHCRCHTVPREFGAHAWPGYVDGDIEFDGDAA